MTIDEFVVALQAKITAANTDNQSAPEIIVEFGPRYARIIIVRYSNQRSVYGFIDRTNGDLLKADIWKRPAKTARGNLADADPLAACTPWGIAYLR
jgi:hypothetical protein